MTPFIDYELTTILTFLGLRKTDKAQLEKNLKNAVEPSALSLQAKYVLDGSYS